MTRYYRKVIRIAAEDSPNVRLALAQLERGEKPTGEVLVPGVLPWEEYQKRRKLWDKKKQCVSLDGQFYKGGEIFLFPDDVLSRSLLKALKLNKRKRYGTSIGVDAAEGNDDSCWTVIDKQGVVFQLSMKTEDTSDVPGITIGLMREYRVKPEMVMFDRGGGGKQHADQLRKRGFDVRTVFFGEKATDPHKDRKTATVKDPVKKRVEKSEIQTTYKNRRAEMYAICADLFASDEGFAIDRKYAETIRQLKIMPRLYNDEGQLYLPPKDKPNPNYTGVTIKGILGRSPDQADSLVLATYAHLRRPLKVTAGAA